MRAGKFCVVMVSDYWIALPRVATNIHSVSIETKQLSYFEQGNLESLGPKCAPGESE